MNHVVPLVSCFFLALSGCGHASSTSDPGPPASDSAACDPGFDFTNGTCAPHFDECTEPTTIPKPGGGCAVVGVPPDQCGAGFVTDGNGGCDAVLPKDPCPSGTMAVPGETTCREAAPCGTGTWGDIPVEASTIYVDRGYLGGANDGSKARPFGTIQEGLDKATKGAIVAVGARAAKETYEENIFVSNSVRLWGRCPALVEVKSAATDAPIAYLTGPAELHRLAITGPWHGIDVRGPDALIEQVWIHDVGHRALVASPGRITVRNSLIERSTEVGLVVFSSEVTIDGSIVRDTRTRADGKFGRGVDIGLDPATTSKTGSKVTVRGSLIERNVEDGLIVSGSELTLDASVIRDTHARADGTGGRGLSLVMNTALGLGSTATVQGSLIERNGELGVFVNGSDLTVEASVIRDTLPGRDGLLGGGFSIEADPITKVASTAIIRRSLVDRNNEVGVGVYGSELTLEGSVIRDTRANAQGTGPGLGIATHSMTKTGSAATVAGSLIERNVEAGVSVYGSQVTVDASVVRGTKSNEAFGKFGDGLAVFVFPWTDEFGAASLALTHSIVRDNARAGLSTFGARLEVTGSIVQCNLFDVDFETVTVTPSGNSVGSIDDVLIAPGNVCGCGAAASCTALSKSLEPLQPPRLP